MIVESRFRPARWLPGPHLQTLFPKFYPAGRSPYVRRERLELPDGDFLDLDYGPNTTGARVLILHGLEGSSRSHYAVGLGRALSAAGLQPVVMHFRGCSGEPNRRVRSYHSGETGDLAYVADLLHRRAPTRALAAVGFSLGGNVLLKWLGEAGASLPLSRTAAVSVPLQLARAADRLACGASRLYQWSLLRALRDSVRRKGARMPLPLATDPRQLRTFRAFDDAVTAPLHGFADAETYYRECSARQFLSGIATPTLILHARDDPFMSPDVLPEAGELPPAVTLELAEHGGHVGFVEGPPWRPRFWLESRLVDYFSGADVQPGTVGGSARTALG